MRGAPSFPLLPCGRVRRKPQATNDFDGGGMVGEAGIEPTTPGLEGRCSIQLSYSPLESMV
jgi:hypothetical protein